MLGLNLNNIYFINKVTKVKKLIIPEQSYQSEVYYSDQYLSIFQTVAKNIEYSNEQNHQHVYFARSINNNIKKEIGLELIDDLFKKNNYTIIYPEQESLDKQIYLLNNCKKFAAVAGSIFHNVLFLVNNNLEIYCINKTYLNNTHLKESFKIKNISPIYIDAYIALFPVRYGLGPFLFFYNINLKNFIKDKKLKNIEFKLRNYYFRQKQFVNYILSFHQIVIIKNLKIFYDINQNGDAYFSPYHITNFISYFNKKNYIFESFITIFYKFKLKILNIIRKKK